jgi:MFS family permease
LDRTYGYPESELNREEKKILSITASSHHLVHLYEGVLPPLIPILLTEFGTDYFHLGMVVTIFSYAFGLGALPAGYLADRIGSKELIVFYLFGAGMASVLVLPIESLVAYAVIMGCIGLFCSLYHPAANALISHVFQQKGKAFAVNGIAGSLGIAVVPVFSAWIGSFFGWRVPHIIFGLIGIALGCFALALPKRSSPAVSTDRRKDEKLDRYEGSYLNLVLFFLTAVFLGITYRGIMTFLPAYMGQKVQSSFIPLDPVAIGGTIATVALVFGGVGQYIAGHLVDRYKVEKLYFGVMIIATLWVFLMSESTNALLIVSAVLFALFYFANQPIQNYIIASYLPKHRQGLGFGIHFFLVFSVGSTAAAISGYLADRFGLVSVFHVMATCLLISALIAGVLLFRTRATTFE